MFVEIRGPQGFQDLMGQMGCLAKQVLLACRVQRGPTVKCSGLRLDLPGNLDNPVCQEIKAFLEILDFVGRKVNSPATLVSGCWWGADSRLLNFETEDLAESLYVLELEF